MMFRHPEGRVPKRMAVFFCLFTWTDGSGQTFLEVLGQPVEAEKNLPEISADKSHRLLKYAESICYHMQNSCSP